MSRTVLIESMHSHCLHGFLILHAPYSVLISVTGGAQDFDINKDLDVALKRGLRRVSRMMWASSVGDRECRGVNWKGQPEDQPEYGGM